MVKPIFRRETNLKEDDPDSGDEKKRKRPEDSIPDLPENQKAREFLKNAPTKGLWLPLGSEVKTMQCFRCKAFGHRSGDRECPLREQGNVLLDSQRQAREDPMSTFVAKKSDGRREQIIRVTHLKRILQEIKEIQREYKKVKYDENKKKKRRR